MYGFRSPFHRTLTQEVSRPQHSPWNCAGSAKSCYFEGQPNLPSSFEKITSQYCGHLNPCDPVHCNCSELLYRQLRVPRTGHVICAEIPKTQDVLVLPLFMHEHDGPTPRLPRAWANGMNVGEKPPQCLPTTAATVPIGLFAASWFPTAWIREPHGVLQHEQGPQASEEAIPAPYYSVDVLSPSCPRR